MSATADSLDTQTLLQKGRVGYVRLLGRLHQVKVLGVENKRIWVSFPGEHYPVEGLGVDLEFHQESGFVSYHTRVIRGAAQPGDGLVLERSESIEERRHRESWRIPTDIAVAVSLDGAPRTFSARMLNLGTGGMTLRTHAKLPLHAEVMLQFDLPVESGLLARGRVVHGRAGTNLASHPSHLYGVQFMGLSKEVSKTLTYYLWGRIRETKADALRALYPHADRRRRSTRSL